MKLATVIKNKKLKEEHPLNNPSNDLDGLLEGINVVGDNYKDELISLLTEMDDSIGTNHAIYKRLEKLVDSFERIETVLINIVKSYKSEIEL